MDIIIDDRNFNELTQDEKNAVYMRKFGKPYAPPTENEKQEILKSFGISE